MTYTSKKMFPGNYNITTENGKVYNVDRRYKNEVGYDGWAVGEIIDGDVNYEDVANTKAQAIEWAITFSKLEG